MKSEEIRSIVLRQLSLIAPEVRTSELRLDANLREQVDLDSMDFLSLLIGVGHELGIEIPEADYGQIDTIDHLVDYLGRHARP
jgi:acyl carrier protein